MSLTQVLTFMIFAGTVLYFIFNFPSVLPLVNIVLAIVYALFVFNMISFKVTSFNPLLVLLLMISTLSVIQLITNSRKYAVFACSVTLSSALIALLLYSGVIEKLVN
ncbi:MAG TPA: hypothetical protein DHW82_11490 [Spirochaetia bacterium]|nr:MAG: hypothetical protein A2Y41_10060 [Spirochaetes bacterium GWB1_36_13]HCL57615.1 hypothetical protein [Spirochaetia bacterium]